MRTALLALVGLAAALPAEAVEIAFTTRGGDAWTFDKRIEARVSDGRCDELRMTSPAGTAVATPSGSGYAAVLRLAEGKNRVQAVCLQGGREVARSSPQTWTQRLTDKPVARVRIHVAEGKLVLDAGGSDHGRAGAPIVAHAWTGRADNPALGGSLGPGRRLELAVPTKDGDYHLTLHVTDQRGRSDESTVLVRVKGGKAEPVDLAERPAWADRAVVYGVIPGLFGKRGLADVTARLDDIAATGATVLWLSPITQSPDDDFGYAVSDYFAVRDKFGSADDLKALVAGAHARGMRVIMDFVPNHASDQHPYYRDAATHGAASAYAGWFQRDAEGKAAHYFDWTNLKNLDYDNPEVRRMMTEAFAHWVRAFGIDGFRVDAAWGVRQRAPEFWREWRAELKRIDPDLWLLAETSARDPWYAANGFDAGYDWGEGLGQWAWKDVFKDGRADLVALRAALAANDGRTPTMRFLNNNDTGRRFADQHGLGLARAAAGLLFTLPGMPLIYTGDELAAAFEPYDEGAPLDWASQAPLRGHYARLSALRQAEPALRRPDMQPVATERDDAVLAYWRGDLLVMVNFTAEPVTLSHGEAGQDLWTGEAVAAGQVTLPPHGMRVLRPEVSRRTS